MTIKASGFGSIPDNLLHKPRISPSGLKKFRVSPRHYKNRKAFVQTPAMYKGECFHLALLEPEKYRENLITMPEFPRKSKDQPLSVAEQKTIWKNQNPNAIRLGDEDKEDIESMLEACSKHKIIPGLVKGFDDNLIEQPMWYDDGQVVWAMRPDLIIPSKGIVVDVKTAVNASPDKFYKTIYDLEYFIAAKTYLEACQHQFKKEFTKFIWIVIESQAPFSAVTYFADFGLLELAEQEIEKSIESFLKCKEEDNWPSYGEGLIPGTIPAWAWQRYEYKEKEQNNV